MRWRDCATRLPRLLCILACFSDATGYATRALAARSCRHAACRGADAAAAVLQPIVYSSSRWRRRGGLDGVVAVAERTAPAPQPSAADERAEHEREAPDLSVWTAVRGALQSDSFHEWMVHVRAAHGDVVRVNLWPVLPPIYLMMGKKANRGVLFELDSSLEQVLQELINFLPVSARIPSEVDEELQRKVKSLFQNVSVVDTQLKSFNRVAQSMRERWLERPLDAPLDVFFELSEYVLLADLEVLYGTRFREMYGAKVLPSFRRWVENIANGQLVGFFAELGDYLKVAIAEQLEHPERYAGERSVMSVYLQEGALEDKDLDEVVGLLTMTLMAAVFNTQVSLAWILVHLYSQPELLAMAREELKTCPDLESWAQLQKLPFLNSCIDESVRLHTMLPGNTVLRKAVQPVRFDGVEIPQGSLLWLYPNAVHQDESYFAEAASFCPMRLMKEGSAPLKPARGGGGGGGGSNELRRMSDEFELVTFGHGQKRCIGEKMARASICAFLGTMLPELEADPPATLPADNNLFDLIPASKLQLLNVRAKQGAAAAATAPSTTPAV